MAEALSVINYLGEHLKSRNNVQLLWLQFSLNKCHQLMMTVRYQINSLCVCWDKSIQFSLLLMDIHRYKHYIHNEYILIDMNRHTHTDTHILYVCVYRHWYLHEKTNLYRIRCMCVYKHIHLNRDTHTDILFWWCQRYTHCHLPIMCWRQNNKRQTNLFVTIIQ